MFEAERWNEIRSRMTAFWAREETERCCVSIRVPVPGWQEPAHGNFYFDTAAADAANRAAMANTVYFGEAFPCVFPYFGTAGIAEYTGCRPTRTPVTTWFEPWLTDDGPDASRIGFSHPEAFERQRDAVRELVEMSRGEYPVSVTDNAGILDALAAIRGTDELMTDMIADPEFVEEGVRRLLPVYTRTQEELFALVRENNRGCVHSWMQLWAPERLAQLQCDLSVMISPDMYARFVLPELEALCAYLEYPVYHFDGQEQIRHLDHLLSVRRLRAIQWTPVAGQPPTSAFLPVLQRIQQAGKNLVLFPRPGEVADILGGLSSRGLHLVIDGLKDPDEAAQMMQLVQKLSRVR